MNVLGVLGCVAFVAFATAGLRWRLWRKGQSRDLRNITKAHKPKKVFDQELERLSDGVWTTPYYGWTSESRRVTLKLTPIYSWACRIQLVLTAAHWTETDVDSPYRFVLLEWDFTQSVDPKIVAARFWETIQRTTAQLVGDEWGYVERLRNQRLAYVALPIISTFDSELEKEVETG